MSTARAQINDEEEVGLIIQQAADQEALVKYLTLVLNYLYGINVVLLRSAAEATGLLMERADNIRCAFLIQDQDMSNQMALSALSLRGQIPLFLLLPEERLERHQKLTQEAKNVFLYSWERVSNPGQEPTLRQAIDEVFARNNIGGLFDRAQHVSFRVLQQRVQRRLKNLNTLPTLPQIVQRIMRVLNDEESTTEDLEEVLLSDSAVVHKLLQVVNTPAFAGTAQRGGWNLREAIVRLGRKKIGSIALQIKLINSLVKPQESGFDMRRFWVHSVGCALIADRIVLEKMVDIRDWDACGDYWIASLLHDVGKLTLGFFFWSYFAQILETRDRQGIGFREAERHLGDVVTHEQVGQLLLLRVGMEPDLVKAVSSHHQPESPPSPMTCLVHLADNLCKDLEMGYESAERGVYSDSVLRATGLDAEKVEALRQQLSSSVREEVGDLVGRCMRR